MLRRMDVMVTTRPADWAKASSFSCEQARVLRMKTINRGDIPAPHVPPGQGKVTVDPAEQVVFEADELSFVQDWVEGADGQEPPIVDHERDVREQSGQNRRLGVGAVAKKSSHERVRDYLRMAVVLADAELSRCTSVGSRQRITNSSKKGVQSLGQIGTCFDLSTDRWRADAALFNTLACGNTSLCCLAQSEA